jgi:hypothetical protein
MIKTNRGFKIWLKENYSCSKCNEEFFSFQKTDEKDEIKFIFYWQNKTQDPEPDSLDVFLNTRIEKVCQNCGKSGDK